MGDALYESGYIEGIRRFNAHEFFEAHEAWEEVWKRSLDPQRLFLKGLIHAAVALHHFGNGNLKGARKVFGSCLRYLTPYAPRYMGLDVGTLVAQIERCSAGLRGPGGLAAGARLDKSLIPRIELDRESGVGASRGSDA